jgi:nitroimidazol reductase NimA-like FMN-containing flavoprotein (pyridoxamine 5'-phosphate oxidase superfamily)
MTDPVRSVLHASSSAASQLARLRRAPRGALDNARRAAGDLAVVVAQRALLTSSLLDPAAEQDEPGALRRMGRQESVDLLGTQSVGRLGYIARAGVPDIVPVNFVLDGDDILIASGPGPKFQAAERGDTVVFEVDALDLHNHTGWSVVVHGQARHVTGAEARTAVAPRPWASGPRNRLIRIRPARITGRRLS